MRQTSLLIRTDRRSHTHLLDSLFDDGDRRYSTSTTVLGIPSNTISSTTKKNGRNYTWDYQKKKNKPPMNYLQRERERVCVKWEEEDDDMCKRRDDDAMVMGWDDHISHKEVQ